MPANIETMFFVRVAPWHGLGVRVESALSSAEAFREVRLRLERNSTSRNDFNLHPNPADRQGLRTCIGGVKTGTIA